MLPLCNSYIHKDMRDILKIREFLREVDPLFPVPLSRKQNLDEFALKLLEKATLCTVELENRIIALVAGYTDNVVDRLGYVSIVATLPMGQGQGYASSLMREFLGIAQVKGLCAVHLYTDRENKTAVKMYKKLGFKEWQPENDPRPGDLHLICCLGREFQ